MGYILSNLNVTIPRVEDAMLVVRDDGNIGSKKVIHGDVTISTFESSSCITEYKVLSGVPDGSLVFANIAISTQTPYSSVREVITTPVNNNRFNIKAYGSGFVNGHLLNIFI